MKNIYDYIEGRDVRLTLADRVALAIIAALPAGIRGDITLPGAPAAPAPRPSRPRPEIDEIALLIEGN